MLYGLAVPAAAVAASIVGSSRTDRIFIISSFIHSFNSSIQVLFRKCFHCDDDDDDVDGW